MGLHNMVTRPLARNTEGDEKYFFIMCVSLTRNTNASFNIALKQWLIIICEMCISSALS